LRCFGGGCAAKKEQKAQQTALNLLHERKIYEVANFSIFTAENSSIFTENTP
jgi:hypothetical protein